MPPTAATDIAILARAPVPGRSKTRLIPRLGAVGAACLQQRLTARAIDTAIAAGLGRVVLWGTPDHRHPSIAEQAIGRRLELHSQVDGDLGARMLAAVAASRSAAGVLVIGTDCPALTPDHLGAAAAALAGGDEAVVIPAEDGGYVLIGLRRPEPAVFAGVDWGSAQVMAQTRERITSLGLRWRELPPLWDVDRPADLDRVAALWPWLVADLGTR
ncbi:MAG: TIGR04282 family arsenosugar biosynthesis glycosyltransferase [Rhodocyclaceae bacterium]|nr:TIGR04282 family arsenosugar biosynthesis glycosyltransferase [Rhodocyclaceae bacterium]